MNYAQQLLDPRWQKKRLEILERDGWRCCSCENDKDTLHVHHKYYVSHRFAWEYPDFCFQTLCSDCHSALKRLLEITRHEQDKYSLFEDWEVQLDQAETEYLAQLKADFDACHP